MKENNLNLPKFFNKLDVDDDATLSYVELENGLKKIGIQLSKEEKKTFFNYLDYNKDNAISIKELVDAF